MYSCERTHKCVCYAVYVRWKGTFHRVYHRNAYTAACDMTNSLQSSNIMQRVRAGKMTNI